MALVNGCRATVHHGDAASSGGTLARFYIRVATPLLRTKIRWRFLIAVGLATVASLSLFDFKDVAVKLLPFDNKSEVQVGARSAAGRADRGDGPNADGSGPARKRSAGISSRSRPMPGRRRRSTSTASCATITCATSRRWAITQST